MDLRLRYVASHPLGGKLGMPTDFALSSRSARLVTACGNLLVDHDTSTNAFRASTRTSSHIDKVLYVGGGRSFLVFMDNGRVASYVERLASLQLAEEKEITGIERSVRLVQGSYFGKFALFCKVDSPSLWCLPINENGTMLEAFKLRSDIEGDQENVNFVGGVVAKVRGKVASKPKSRICPIVAIAMHPSHPFAAAAYNNGIIRVWDVAKKEQRSHFDAQLLMSEKIGSIAWHPVLPVVVLCTSQGRIMTFYMKAALYKRGDEPVLATSKTRDRKRRFQAMCFVHGNPAYLMLLTASRRIIVRMIGNQSLIVNSSRYAKPSRILPLDHDSNMESDHPGVRKDAGQDFAVLKCEPAFGLIAASFSNDEKVLVFQPRTNSIGSIRPPLSSGLDTGFSTMPHVAFTGPVTIPSDSLVVHRGSLFRYELKDECVSKICDLPPGDFYRIEIARDQYGYCCAALVFYFADEASYPTQLYEESEDSAKYVLCTRRGDAELWNVSEANEGRAGCFLNEMGREDRIIILANSGSMVSLSSFAPSSSTLGEPPMRPGRGVQRFKLDGRTATQVFRAPFASWTAVLYYSPESQHVCLSKNASSRKRLSHSGESQDSTSITMTEVDLCLEDRTALRLHETETVVDVRWQKLPSKRKHETYLGAIMTEQRIYFVQDMLLALSVFEFQRNIPMDAPLSLPSFSWVGPVVMVISGNSLVAVSLNGRADTIAGISYGRNVSALVAALPDRIVYARPCPERATTALSISSRQYGALSGLLRGMLTLPDEPIRADVRTTDQVYRILELQDVSQGSVELTKTLIAHSMSPVAYLLATSQKGRLSMPPIRRAMFMGRMGDTREALTIIEEQCSRLSHANALHAGSELFRVLQRILNVAFATGEFSIGRRCSTLLGRSGTFSAFVDVEGGNAAVKSIADHVHSNGNTALAQFLQTLIEKSSQSSTAMDSSIIPSLTELQKMRRARQTIDFSSISLGNTSTTEIFVASPPTQEEHGSVSPASCSALPQLVPSDMSERLEMSRRVIELEASDYVTVYADLSDDTEVRRQGTGTSAPSLTQNRTVEGGLDDSSDEEAIFQIRSKEPPPHSADANISPETPIENATTGIVERNAEETRRSIRALKDATAGPVQEARQATHELMRSQRLAAVDGQTVPTLRANEMIERGTLRLDDGRYSSAQKHFESALRAISRGKERGQHTSPDLISQLVHYRLFAQVRAAMEDIRSSTHSTTAAGKQTYTQLATALTALPLQQKHRIEALVIAADANMMMNNFGTAAHALQAIKEIGVPETIRPALRDKYAMCAARGFANAQEEAVPKLCYRTLRTFKPGLVQLSCNVCPAKFLPDASLSSNDTCPICRCGTIRGA